MSTHWTVTKGGLALPYHVRTNDPPKKRFVWPEEAETYAGTIVGWRAWTLQDMRDRPLFRRDWEALLAAGNPEVVLSAIATFGLDGFWLPARKQAQCALHLHPSEQAPAAGCSCGLWAVRKEDLWDVLSHYDDLDVIGSVHLWGRVVEAERGWRGQYAYPKKLWLIDYNEPEDRAAVEKVRSGLERAYRVPVKTISHGRALEKWSED